MYVREAVAIDRGDVSDIVRHLVSDLSRSYNTDTKDYSMVDTAFIRRLEHSLSLVILSVNGAKVNVKPRASPALRR